MTTEVKELLKHPDPRERAIALSLDSATPEDVAVGVLDPSPLVWRKAFYHTNSQHALDVLAANSRDAAGNPLTERHDLLLNDPRCHSGHVDSIYRAVQNDKFLPVDQQAARLAVLKLRAPLRKSEGEANQIKLDHQPDPFGNIVDVSKEESRHPELLEAYNKGVNSYSPIQPQDADLHDIGRASPKVVYHASAASNEPENKWHKFMVKPYSSKEFPRQGWNESTSQEVYEAAEIPHLHQKSFVGSYNNGGEHIPATIIDVEQAKPIHKVPKQEVLQKNPNAAEDARKIATMDFLLGNPDRHSGNLMIRDNGQLLAIDNGIIGEYAGRGWDPDFDPAKLDAEYVPSIKNKSHLGQYDRRAPSLLTQEADPEEPYSHLSNDLDYHRTIKNWWPLISPDVKRTFQKRLELIQNPAVKRHLEAGFNARHKWLDNAAKIGTYEFQDELQKSVEDPFAKFKTKYPVIPKTPPEAKKYESVHKELLNSHPAHLQPQVDKFEKYVNHPTNPVNPEKGDLDGIEQKALVKHADNKYLLKAASTPWNPLSGWAEMASQAMYHAGGLGHLHQHVHATNLNIKEGANTRQQPAVAIHFRPGKWRTLGEVKRDGKPGEAKDFINNNEKDLAKTYVLDFLTGNMDRHDGNILVGPKGEPQMIDQAFAFRRDDWSNPEDQRFSEVDHRGVGDVPDGGAFNFNIFANDHGLGMMANKDTHDWWLQHKKPIVEAFQKHIDMIPDKAERARRKAMFEYRINAVDNKHPLLFRNENDREYYKSEDLEKGLDDKEHEQALKETGMWGRKRAGCVVKSAKTGRVLLPLRSKHVQEPRTWGTWGGAIDSQEDEAGAAERELREESGYKGPVKMTPMSTFQNGSFKYHNFLAEVGDEFTPKLDWENETSRWFHPHEIPKIKNLHFGVSNLLKHPPSRQMIGVPEEKPPFVKTESLSKGAMSKHPFTPHQPGTPETYAEPLNTWVSKEDPKAREQLGMIGMEPNARVRALHKLHANTEVRRNPKTNEREFLLHRGFGSTQVQNLNDNKFDSTKPRLDKPKNKRTIPYTSWSVDPKETHTSDHMVSAFVPESKIAFYIPQYNRMPGLNETANQLGQDEKEVIVEPGQYDIFHQDRGRDWLSGLKSKIEGLHKSLGNASFLHDQHNMFPTQQGMQANMKGVHEKLMKAVPSSLGPNIRHFEIAVNQSKNPVKPIAEQKELPGLQPKALYEHNGKKYLVKTAVENSTAMGAWNEITSQALYHSGNIGHLHQKVHATIGQTGLNRSEPAHALAIHIEPQSMTLGDASGWTDMKGVKHLPKDLERFNNTFKNPEHVESLRRIGMLDYLTGNSDRHLMNIVLKPDGSPIAIDQGRSFHPHRKHALGKETSEDLMGQDLKGNPYDHEAGFLADPGYKDRFIPDYEAHMKDSLAAEYGGKPIAETWKWSIAM